MSSHFISKEMTGPIIRLDVEITVSNGKKLFTSSKRVAKNSVVVRKCIFLISYLVRWEENGMLTPSWPSSSSSLTISLSFSTSVVRSSASCVILLGKLDFSIKDRTANLPIFGLSVA